MRLLGFDYRSALGDLPDAKLWRLDPGADYGPLNTAARGKIDLEGVQRHWPDLVRLAASIHTGAVSAHDVIRMLASGGKPTQLCEAAAHYGAPPSHTANRSQANWRARERCSSRQRRPVAQKQLRAQAEIERAEELVLEAAENGRALEAEAAEMTDLREALARERAVSEAAEHRVNKMTERVVSELVAVRTATESGAGDRRRRT